jgi:hypothetical protein
MLEEDLKGTRPVDHFSTAVEREERVLSPSSYRANFLPRSCHALDGDCPLRLPQ